MRKKLIKPAVSDAAAEFSQLFWAARRGHVQLKKKATGDEPGDKSAVEFTKSQGWQWAEGLLEASRLDMLGEHGKALKLLAACEPSVPSQWHGLVHFLRGATLAGTGKYDEAIKAYRKALDDTNFDRPSYAWYNLGNALGAKGEYDEAIKAYRKVIDDTRYDKPARAWNNLGATLRSKGEHDEAIKAFRKAIDDPKYDSPAKAWANLGETYEEIGNREKAQEAFKKALASPDLEGGDHTRARFRLRLLNAKIKPAALSQDDRAMVEKAASSASTDDVEGKIITAIQDAGDTQYEKYLVHPDSKRDDILSILRGWSSAVTLLEGSERRWRGGGYFLKWRGYGVVIDPGFDFLRNFHDAGYHGREISAVVVSHNHPDHNSDLKGIDDLRYEIWKRLAATKKPGGRPYVLVWDQDTDRSTKFNIQKPAHQYEPVVMSSGYPQPFDLQTYKAKIPVRITPFKVDHGSDVPHAMGMLVELLDEKGNCVMRIGYTADTAYFPALHKHLLNCDLLIAHISQPSIEELQDASKLKEDHLGYRGMVRLLGECNPKLTLVDEFWAGFTDLRIPIVKALRQRSGVDAVLPAGIGMHVRLPGMEVECSGCAKPTPFAQVKVAPSANDFGNLAYLCPGCMIG